MANPPTTSSWQVVAWSRERGRGAIRSAAGHELGFDASVALVDDLRLGEPVDVGFDPADPSRVVSVRPRDVPETALRFEPGISVEPTGLLALRVEGQALQTLEELVFERLDIATIVDFATGYVTDFGPAFRALVEAHVGRHLDEVVRVSADYPFDWSGLGDLDQRLASVARTLPGYTAGSPYFFAPIAVADTPPPPHLSFSIETIGLQISGVLPRRDWAAWRAAFERAMARTPMRTG